METKQTTTSPDSKKGGVQLSEKAIQERIRARTPELLQELFDLALMAVDPKTVSTKMSALKTLLAKVSPDLSATDLTSGGEKLSSNVVGLPAEKPIDELSPSV